MDHTSRMTALLGRFRRERNGAVADTMGYRGRRYGLNYGVSLPTVRSVARAEGRDHEFARYLFLQDVRELRLAALWIAEPERIGSGEFAFWAGGIVNSELAEECAFALLSRARRGEAWCRAWSEEGEELLQYAAIVGAARIPEIDLRAWLPRLRAMVAARPDSALLARGGEVLLSALLASGRMPREELAAWIGTLPEGGAARRIADELSWRMEG